MKVSITGIKEIQKAFKKLNSKLKSRLLKDIGRKQIQRIKQKASRGRGYKGPFKRYSPSYAARSGKSVVNLRESGHLMDSFDFTLKQNELEINNDAIYAEFVDMERPFMGLDSKDQKEIFDQITKNINNTIRRAGF